MKTNLKLINTAIILAITWLIVFITITFFSMNSLYNMFLDFINIEAPLVTKVMVPLFIGSGILLFKSGLVGHFRNFDK